MSVLTASCCATTCGMYNPWIRGVSNDGYQCDGATPQRTNLAIGTDFGLTPYASFCDGSAGCDPCEFHGIAPYDRALANTFPTQINYTPSNCNAFPEAINYCCCTVSNFCVPAHGGTQCEWFANDNDYAGSWFTPFNLLCLKTGIDIASQTVEEDNYISCCGGWFGEQNCGEVACGCDQLYGDTTCNRSKIAYTFGDGCDVAVPCPPNVEYQYFTDEPTLTFYYGFQKAVDAGVLEQNDPLGQYEQALVFTSLNGNQFTARMLLHDHIVDSTYDIQNHAGILSGYQGFGGVPDGDGDPTWGSFPTSPYSPMNAGGGYMPWVSISLTMTTGAYSGTTYTYHGYGTAEHFQIWAQSNWAVVTQGIIQVTGSPNYWLGLRISPYALDTTTGHYTPFHEYRRIVTRQVTEGGILGWMPDNSDDFKLQSTSNTQVVWTARLRQFYTWRVYTTMQDVRAHGMEITNIGAVDGSCCNFSHCTRLRRWYGVSATDPSVAPCTVTNPLIDISGTCGVLTGSPWTLHADDCVPSKCGVTQEGVTYAGTLTGYTQSTCFPSQYNVAMDYDYIQDPNEFDGSNTDCIILP